MGPLSPEKIQKTAKKDIFESPDFYRIEDLFTEEHLLILGVEITGIPAFK